MPYSIYLGETVGLGLWGVSDKRSKDTPSRPEIRNPEQVPVRVPGLAGLRVWDVIYVKWTPHPVIVTIRDKGS